MPKHGKNYKAAAAKVDSTKLYSPKEAMELAKELSPAKFDETVEVAVRLGVDTRKADQNVRGSIALPHGTGKTVRVAVFAEGEKAREAEAAGADVIIAVRIGGFRARNIDILPAVCRIRRGNAGRRGRRGVVDDFIVSTCVRAVRYQD